MVPKFREDVLALTKELVQHPSIVGTTGERDIAFKIHDLLQEIPYFQDNPGHLRIVQTEGDAHERYNVLALVKGLEPQNEETVILLGHLDTVGIEDYGKWKRFAFSPDALLEKWKQGKVKPTVQRDLETGEWMCGRGSVDMKSGVASNLVLTRHFAQHREELEGNLLLLVECDEEDSSQGILSVLTDLLALSHQERLDYVAAINSDYTSPRFEGDENRYVYLGTVGKLLPAFFIIGKETHAGQAFEGFDPNLVAAELTTRLDYNTDFCDEMYGEVTTPPVSLKQTDLKPSYDVQTPLSAFVYYNFFVHSWSPKDVLERLKEVARTSFEQAINRFQTRYRKFCDLSGEPYVRQELEARVYTYEEFYQICQEEHGEDFEQAMRLAASQLKQDKELDMRQFCCKMVERMWEWAEDLAPAVILFYATLYQPRVVLQEEDERDRRLINAVNHGVDAVQTSYPHPIQIRNFFPYISDMSFVSISDDPDGIHALEKNIPAWGVKLKMDVDAIRALDVPVVNVGPYGMDAHKQWERVEIPYSMEIVPEMSYRIIRYLLEDGKDHA
nr:M20/M25/M40 family metallo-hydrolase [Mechercharimyces sp. CAU 1602]